MLDLLIAAGLIFCVLIWPIAAHLDELEAKRKARRRTKGDTCND